MKRAQLRITPSGDRDLVMTRDFAAPRKLVYDAHTKPELVRQWLGGMPGWTMPVCDIGRAGRRQIPLGVAQRRPPASRWGMAAYIARSRRPAARHH